MVDPIDTCFRDGLLEGQVALVTGGAAGVDHLKLPRWSEGSETEVGR